MKLTIKHYQNPATGKVSASRGKVVDDVVAVYDNGGVKTSSGDVYYNVRKVGENWETVATMP